MLDDTSRIEFLRAGMAPYPAARETVDYFETTLMKLIVDAFVPMLDGREGRA